MKLSDCTPKMLVAYVPTHANGDVTHEDVQLGVVSSVNEKFVFVKYEKQLSKFGWDGTTSEATDPNDLVPFPFPEMHVFTINVGDRVICDWCGQEWTDRPESGGLTFVSKACCPDCAPRIRADAAAGNETHHIRSECPPELSFADWVRTVLRTQP